jgi:hypothetical protein
MLKIAGSRLFIDQEDSTLAKLKIQLDYDKLSKSAFFDIIIKGYLERDPRIISLLQETNKRVSLQDKIKKDEKQFNEVKNDFALEESEIQDIFDIISKENSEL